MNFGILISGFAFGDRGIEKAELADDDELDILNLWVLLLSTNFVIR